MADEDASDQSQDVPGYAPPDTGAGESAASEIPVGVDALDLTTVAAASDFGAEEADEGDEGDGGDGDAVDVSAAVEGDEAAAEDAPPPDPEVVAELEGETGALTEALEGGGLDATATPGAPGGDEDGG